MTMLKMRAVFLKYEKSCLTSGPEGLTNVSDRKKTCRTKPQFVPGYQR